MNDINTTTQIVRLVRDPELRYTPSGKAVASFSGASSKSYTKDGEKHETVSYFDFIAWGRVGETIAEYCKKGHRIAIVGSLEQQRWDDSDGKKRTKIEIVVKDFQFIQNKPSESSPESKPESKPKPGDHGPEIYEENPFSDDPLIPF